MTESSHTCYLSPKLAVRQAGEKGLGLFAQEPIAEGELVIILGGDITTPEQLAQLNHTFSVQIEEQLYISPIGSQPAYRINHSCDPTIGIVGQITFIALRDLVVGDEICFDYAMTDGSPYDEFMCACGSEYCRGMITGNDWQRPELWQRYNGHFSPYLQRRIALLKMQQPQKA